VMATVFCWQLISDAIRYGDCHHATMELADYWLLEKQLVHKLFKVLVPRFENSPVSYTRMYRAPRPCPGHKYKRAVLELRGEVQKLCLFHFAFMYSQSEREIYFNQLLISVGCY
jgi:hypothetical protein